MNSTTESIKFLPQPSDPSIASKNNHIRRAHTLLNKTLRKAPSGEQINKIISNSQSNSHLSKAQIEITPETVHQLNLNQSTATDRRSRVKWVARNASILSGLNFQTTSFNDFHILTMTDNNFNETIPMNPSSSIPDLTMKEVEIEYQNFIEKIYEDELDQALNSGNIAVLTSEDEDEDITNNNTMNNMHNVTDDNDQEPLDTTKVSTEQGSQLVLVEAKSKKKSKGSHRKRNRSSPRRAKQTSALLSATSNQATPNGESTTVHPVRASTSIPKVEDNAGVKSLITVDTSKARSNLQVVRLCLRDLGWKEVIFLVKNIRFYQ